MRKPAYISHYLVLRDLIDGVDVRRNSDTIVYLCSRIENVKCDLIKEGLRFDEEVRTNSTYSIYKPYILDRDDDNMKLAEKLLRRYATDKVMYFIENAA